MQVRRLVFCAGQNSEEGKYFLEKYKSLGGKVISYDPDGSTVELVKKQNCIVDAIFGTGFHGEMPENMKKLAIAIRETVCNLKVAIDVPLGIDADNGSVSEYGIKVDVTVELSYIKPGIISYPARSYVGEIVYDDLGIPQTLREISIPEDALPQLAKDAFADVCTGGNPREITEADILELYKIAY